MTNPDLLTQLQQLSQMLEPYQFGVGGSCLLWQLGIESSPNDIDIVCCEADFAAICTELVKSFSMLPVVPQSDYATQHFARFSKTGWPDIELMARIAVRRDRSIVQWPFQPERCHWQQGVRWMPPADWLQLYQLFNRPQRVAQLRQYLVQLRLNGLSQHKD